METRKPFPKKIQCFVERLCKYSKRFHHRNKFQSIKNLLVHIGRIATGCHTCNSEKTKIVNAKTNNKNQKPFNKMILMECDLPGIGAVKLIVGIKRKSFEKVQYCITAIGT